MSARVRTILALRGPRGVPGPSTTENVSQATTQKIILWGTPGNEFSRVVAADFVPDADVTAALNAIEAGKGSCLTGPQFAAIHDFVAAEKLAGRWALHKRIYLPIWASAAANAVDLVTGATAGTWVNGGAVTHAAGYVQNGSNGHFNVGESPASLGLTNSTNWLVTGMTLTADPTTYGGLTDAASTGESEVGIFYNGTNVVGVGVEYITVADTTRTGIYAFGRDAGTAYLKRLRTAGMLTNTVSSASTYTPSDSNFIFTGLNNNSVPYYYLTSRIGLYSISLGMSQAAADAYMENLKTLWEACTGLTLP